MDSDLNIDPPAPLHPNKRYKKAKKEQGLSSDVVMGRPTMKDPTAMVALMGDEDDDRTKYLAHKEYVCFYSPILKKAFTGDTPDGEMQSFLLEHCHENVLRLFVQWIYRQEICGNDSDDYYYDLIELWLLGGKLGIPSLQDMVIDKLATMPEDYEEGQYMARYIEIVYTRTSEGSPLRRFALAKCAAYMTPEKIRKEFHSKDVLLDYALYVCAKMGSIDPHSWPILASAYHITKD